MSKGDTIKRLRAYLNMSQVELADRIGVSKQTLYKYENNIVTNIPSDKVEAMATALHTEPEVIMGWKEPVANDMLWKLAKDKATIERAKEVAEKYLCLSPEHQATVRIMIDAFLAEEQKEKDAMDSLSG